MISLLTRNHTRNMIVQSCGSKLRKACEGTRTSKDTISDHLIVMLKLVNIPYFSRLSNALNLALVNTDWAWWQTFGLLYLKALLYFLNLI